MTSRKFRIAPTIFICLVRSVETKRSFTLTLNRFAKTVAEYGSVAGNAITTLFTTMKISRDARVIALRMYGAR